MISRCPFVVHVSNNVALSMQFARCKIQHKPLKLREPLSKESVKMPQAGNMFRYGIPTVLCIQMHLLYLEPLTFEICCVRSGP